MFVCVYVCMCVCVCVCMFFLIIYLQHAALHYYAILHACFILYIYVVSITFIHFIFYHQWGSSKDDTHPLPRLFNKVFSHSKNTLQYDSNQKDSH